MVIILNTRELVPEFSVTLKWRIKLIRNWMKWKVVDQKISRKVPTWIKPEDWRNSHTWLTQNKRVCVCLVFSTCIVGCWKCSKRVSPNGQTFSRRCPVPPPLSSSLAFPCYPLFCSARYKPKDTAFPFTDAFLSSLQRQRPHVWNQNNHSLIFSSIEHLT